MTTPAPSVDLRPDHWAIVRDALRHHVPDREVLAFGSRATWTAKEYSDLDLAVMGEEALSLRTVSALDEALGDSDLPFKVDVVDWARIDEGFRRIVRRHGVVVQAPTGASDAIGPTRPSSPAFGRSGMADGRWSRVSLGDFVTLQRGHDLPAAVRRPGSTPILGSSGVTGWHDESRAPGPGVTVGRSGASFGVVSYSPVDFWPLNTALYVTDFHGNDQRFAYYLLRHFDFQSYNSGSAQPSLNRNFIHPMPIDVPPVSEQRAIAHVLGTLDDKIELNRRMNETLEAMARALFKSWFVDFDPVRAKMEGRDTGLPQEFADVFPDRLVDSELGEIPLEWKVAPLDEIARFQNGLALQKFRPAKDEARLPVVKIAQLRAGEANSGEWASAAIRPECIIEDGDVLFSWSGSLLVKTWCGGRAALNQHLFKVTSARYPKWFFLHSLLSHLRTFRRIAQDKATTMGHIRRHHLTEALCVAPPDDVIESLSGTFSCLLAQRVVNELSSRTLAALRDTLLPQLISGELRVHRAKQSLGRTE